MLLRLYYGYLLAKLRTHTKKRIYCISWHSVRTGLCRLARALARLAKSLGLKSHTVHNTGAHTHTDRLSGAREQLMRSHGASAMPYRCTLSSSSGNVPTPLPKYVRRAVITSRYSLDCNQSNYSSIVPVKL